MTGAALTRRAFLAASASTAAALTLGGCAEGPSSAAPRTRRGRRVVVIGAGLAGLIAADALVADGFDVTVLEARTRPGGRVRTLRAPFADGLHAEAGATFVPAHHHHTVDLAARLGVALVPAAGGRGGGARVHVGGRRIDLGRDAPDWPLALRPDERGATPAALRARYLGPVLDALGDPAHPAWPGEHSLALDDLSLAALLRREGASDAAVRLVRLGYLDEWGDGIDSVSALSLLRDLRANDAVGPAYRVADGADALPRGLAEGLDGRVRYGAAAVRIEQARGRIAVTYTQAGVARTIPADHAVAAVPFPLLRRIAVDPRLPPAQARAVAELPATSVLRAFLQLRRAPWDDDAPASVPTDLPVMQAGIAAPGTGGRAIVEAFVTGPSARRLAAMERRARSQWIARQVDALYPGTAGVVEQTVVVAWDHDPWSRGDYAWFRPGQMRTLGPHLATPAGRLHLAGDQTSALPGWMQGALASGLRAADEIRAAA